MSGFGRKFFKKRFNHFVPAKVDNILRYLRYLVLAWVIYMTAVTGTLIFSTYDPYFALFNFWSSEVSLIGVGVLLATLALSFFVERPWCKYACPYGAVLGISNLFRVFTIRRNGATCKADGACSIMCPMNIPVDSLTVVKDHQCISCLECTSEAICPVAQNSRIFCRKWPMKLTSKTLAAIVAAIMFGGIYLSSALGLWQTESTKVAAAYVEGEFAGQANPADIRGSYTFGDVEKNFNLPAATLAEAFGVETQDPAVFQVKSLEEIYADSPLEVGTASVRLFVALYKGLPMDLSTDMYLPEAVVALLSDKNLSAEQTAYLETHTVTASTAPVEAPASSITPTLDVSQVSEPTPTAVHSESADTEMMVKGKTMFSDLLAWGVEPEVIESVLGKPLPAAPGMTIKDFCTQNGLNFETIKPALQAEVDKLK